MDRKQIFTAAAAMLSVLAASAGHTQQIFSGTGATTTTSLNDFRTAIGGQKNGGAPQPSGRREITWDGVKLDGTDANPKTSVIVPNSTVAIPVNRFQNAGAFFEEVYDVSGDGFAGVNPGVDYGGKNPFFSPKNTFAMSDEHTIGMSFVIPSAPNTTPIAAASRGFGAIFNDVELANTSSIELFSGSSSLGKYYVTPGANGDAEFLGILFDRPIITSVELTLGNANLFDFDGHNITPGAADDPLHGIDLAVTDDFVFAEPTKVPEPSTWGFLASCVVGFSVFGIRRTRKSR